MNKGNNPLSKFLPGGKKNTVVVTDNFEEYRSQLEQRVGVVEQGLVRCGVRVAELGTEEVVEFFYQILIRRTEKPMQINEYQVYAS